MNELDEILKKLGDPNKIGANNTWVGKHYSVANLINDLQEIKKRLDDDLK